MEGKYYQVMGYDYTELGLVTEVSLDFIKVSVGAIKADTFMSLGTVFYYNNDTHSFFFSYDKLSTIGVGFHKNAADNYLSAIDTYTLMNKLEKFLDA